MGHLGWRGLIQLSSGNGLSCKPLRHLVRTCGPDVTVLAGGGQDLGGTMGDSPSRAPPHLRGIPGVTPKQHRTPLGTEAEDSLPLLGGDAPAPTLTSGGLGLF